MAKDKQIKSSGGGEKPVFIIPQGSGFDKNVFCTETRIHAFNVKNTPFIIPVTVTTIKKHETGTGIPELNKVTESSEELNSFTYIIGEN